MEENKMSAMKRLLEDTVCNASKMSGIDEGVLMSAYGKMYDTELLDDVTDKYM